MSTASQAVSQELQQASAIRVRPLSPALGAEIRGIDLAAPVARETIRAIRQLWYDHCVLLVPGQTLDEAGQVRFGEYFGELATTLGTYAILKDSHPAVMYVTNEKADGKYVGALPDGEMFFHSDMCYTERPCLGTMLYAMEIPSQGGNTLFANQYQAYETLPEATKERIANLKAVNSFEPGRYDNYAAPITRAAVSQAARSAAHPMVLTHPATGRKALYVNRLMTEYVVGLPREESNALLESLFDHQEQPQFVYEHRWTRGDVVIWDNRCVLHARTDFSAAELRKLRRVTVATDSVA